MKKKTVLRMLSLVVGLSGLLLIGIVVIPMARNEARARQEYPDLISPIPGGGRYSLTEALLTNEEKKIEVLRENTVENEEIDYTKATNWFPESVGGRQFAQTGDISFYTITIPELGIDSAAVAIGGDDLTSNLIQYPGTALPGKNGNAVIFGHSILPVFYDPLDYISIFSTIDKLERGDEIFVDYDGISFRYRVKETFKVRPTDVYILNQNEDDSYLSLVTCFPMGHPAKPERLVVRAVLSPI